MRTQSADGVFHEFPEGTDQSVIDRVMKEYAQAPKPEAPGFGEGFGTGLMDKVYGALQFGAHVPLATEGAAFVPEQAPSFQETATAVDEKVRQREKTLENEGYNKGWGRTVGNVAADIGLTAPLSLVSPSSAALGLAGRVGQVARVGLAGGGVVGVLEPATGKNFAAEKTGQIGVGVIFGAGVGAAAGAVESAIIRLITPQADRVARQATDIVVRRLTQDAKSGYPTAEDALKQVAEWNAKGKPMSLSDVGGENTQALGGYVARQPGESRAVARSFLEGRDKTAPERLGQDITQSVSDGGSAFQAEQALMQARKQAARSLYEQAEALQNIWSPNLKRFLEDPDVRRGLAAGYRLERLDALAENREFNPTALGVDLDAEGNVVMRSVPNLRVLDMGKRGLDALISAERDPQGNLSSLGRSLAKVRRAYVGEIDGLDQSGVYQSAREAWAGPSASMDSINFGKTAFLRNPEETAAELAEMTGANQEFARLGVADIMRERIEKIGFGGNEARALIKNTWTKKQLAPFFRSETEFDKFADAVTAEHIMAETRNTMLKGSQTAKRVAEDMSSDMGRAATAASLMHSVATLRPMAALRHAAQLYRDFGFHTNEKLNEAVAKLLFSTNPKFFEEPAASPSYIAPMAPGLGGLIGGGAATALGLN